MKARKTYLDILKGISIVAIVFLHFEEGTIPHALNLWIGSFMISAFYLTSGWLMGLSDKEITVKEHFKKRIRTLVMPYIWFSILLLGFDVVLVLFKYKEPMFLAVELYKTLTLRGIGTLWFLPAILGGELIFIFLKNKNQSVKVAAIAVSFIYIFIYWKLDSIYSGEGYVYRIVDAPFRTVSNVIKAWLIIFGGYLIAKKYGKHIENLSKNKLLFLTAGFLTVSYVSVLVLPKLLPQYMYSVILSPFFIQLICPFSILLLALLSDKVQLNRFFIFWGKNSLILMATHFSILLEISYIVSFYITGSYAITGVNSYYFFLATIILEYPIVYLINNRAKFLIGK